ncbi:MAG: glycosyltransferase family 2 protein [Candidatus Omnitrophica bacterium]|nr:glycosyltransferase family 2 protein [Candidatus Omnitrophota bacterium]
MIKVSLIIPCYNEDKNIKDCINHIPHLPWEREIIVVDDGSTDKTKQIVAPLAGNNLKLISYSANKGKGYALKQGISLSKGEVIAVLDADYTTLPSNLAQVLLPLINNRCDFINGSRFVYPREGGAMQWSHLIANKFTAVILSLVLGVRLTDTLCGFKAFRKKTFLELREYSWPDFELLILAKKKRLRIQEVGVQYKCRKANSSKMNTLRSCLHMPYLLLKSLLYR